MKFFPTLIAATLFAAGHALPGPGLPRDNGNVTLSPASAEMLSRGYPTLDDGISAIPTSKNLEAMDEDCRITIYKNNDCSGIGTIQWIFPITKGNHECFDTRDHHSFWWSKGCSKDGAGKFFTFSFTGCSIWSLTKEVIFPHQDTTGCYRVDTGDNWQSMQWQFWE